MNTIRRKHHGRQPYGARNTANRPTQKSRGMAVLVTIALIAITLFAALIFASCAASPASATPGFGSTDVTVVGTVTTVQFTPGGRCGPMCDQCRITVDTFNYNEVDRPNQVSAVIVRYYRFVPSAPEPIDLCTPGVVEIGTEVTLTAYLSPWMIEGDSSDIELSLYGLTYAETSPIGASKRPPSVCLVGCY